MAVKEEVLDDEKTQSLPDLKDGEMATITTLSLKTCETKKPTHYTEGKLIGDMEGAAKFIQDPTLRKVLKNTVSGLGTAATRAEAIEKLKYSKYIEVKGKYLKATPKGVAFIKWLDKVAPELTDPALTAQWEAELSSVAVSGGGKAFEAKIADFTRKLVSIFKAAPALRWQFTSSTEGSTSMNDTTKQPNKPSDKMLVFAKKIAEKLSIKVPDSAMTDWDECKKFIDDNKDAAMRPSEKQVNFANRIAEEKGLQIPPEALADGRELSKWIDENMSQK